MFFRSSSSSSSLLKKHLLSSGLWFTFALFRPLIYKGGCWNVFWLIYLKKKTAVGYIFKHQSNNGAEALKGETRVFSSFYPFNYKWSAKSLYMHIEHHVFFVVIKQFFFFFHSAAGPQTCEGRMFDFLKVHSHDFIIQPQGQQYGITYKYECNPMPISQLKTLSWQPQPATSCYLLVTSPWTYHRTSPRVLRAERSSAPQLALSITDLLWA